MLPRSGEPTNFINGTVFGEVLIGTDQNDLIRTPGTKPGSGESNMYGGLGDDTYITLSSSKDRIFENPGEGIDTVMTEWFYALPANVENLILTGTLSVSATGNSLDNVIIGNSGKNIIEGLGGADEMWGGAGNDMFVLQGNDTIMDFTAGDYFDLRGFNGITSFEQIQGSMQQVGADTILTLTPNDVVTIKNTLVSDFNASDFILSNWMDGYTLTFEDNFDTLSLHTESQEGTWYPLYPRTGLAAHSTAGKSVQYFTYMGDMGSVGELVGIDPFKVENGIVSLEMAPIPQDQRYNTYGLGYSAGMLNTIGSFSQTYGYFEARIKFAPGMGIHDAFWMLPIDGSGEFEIDVAEQRGSEPNNVMSVTHAIDDGRDISHSKGFTLPTATTEFHTYGVDWQPDYITFYIDGKAVRTQPTFPGLDVPMYLLASIGGGGAYAGAPDDTTPFPAKFEVDYIRAWASPSTVEKGVPVDKVGTDGDDVLYGTSLGDVLNGGLGDDKLYGGAGDDILTGGGGNEDRLDGGFGNDTYLVYAASDKPVEGGGREKGIDTVKTTLSQYTLGQNIENLIFIGDGFFNGNGNNEDNYLRAGDGGSNLSGGAGNDLLQGGEGEDRMHGGNGDDQAHGGGGADDIRGGAGNDLLYGDDGDDLLKGDDGDDILIGGAGADSLYGGAGDDILDGGAGRDRMIGGTGNDIYFVDQNSEWVAEYEGEGIDTIYTALSRYVLDAHVENFVFIGEGGVDITGNFSDNRFTLSAEAHADTMRGGLGDDIYEVNHEGDLVIELAGEGNDTVETTLLNYVLPANVENVIYLGAGRFTGTGNELANMLVGSSNADRLDGKAGADVLQGGAGNDTYVVDDEGDVVIEEAGGGNDRVLSQVSYTLSDHVETLQLSTSKAINATGNAQNNTLIGNAGANVLDGRGGIDTLTGGGGDDTFVFRIGEADSDVITDFTGAGMAGGDILRFIGYGEGATIEQIGSSDYYHVRAIAALGGGVELIRLIGVTNLSAGDYVFGTGDVVVEPPVDDGENVSTFLSTYTLGEGQKNLTYLGTDKFTGTGNAEANTITGGSNADRLDGKAGADVLQGGAGNDTYVVDNEGDVVIEEAGGGNDRVLSQVSYTLSDHVETLQLTTSKAINGTGNALANSLVGNNGANVLDGRGGADTLQGGGGNDVFVFQFGEGDGDTVLDFEGAGAPGGDVLHFLGYGAGATITQIGASDYYSINASADLGGGSEMIRLVGVTSLSADDYLFF